MYLFQNYICPSERQQCALWIKKLCDPETCGSGLTGRKNRNMYARLLLHMLRKGVLEGPFTHKPEAGILKTLPTYMVNTAPIHAFTLICIRQHNTIKSFIGLRPGISGDCWALWFFSAFSPFILMSRCWQSHRSRDLQCCRTGCLGSWVRLMAHGPPHPSQTHTGRTQITVKPPVLRLGCDVIQYVID